MPGSPASRTPRTAQPGRCRPCPDRTLPSVPSRRSGRTHVAESGGSAGAVTWRDHLGRPTLRFLDVAGATGGPASGLSPNDIPAAFDVFLRGVGGDGYQQALRRQIGEDGLAAAAGESAYFFAHEMPALAAWSFGPAEADAVTAPRSSSPAPAPPLVPRECHHPGRHVAARGNPHPFRGEPPAPAHRPSHLGPGDRRLRPPGTGEILTKPAAAPVPANPNRRTRSMAGCRSAAQAASRAAREANQATPATRARAAPAGAS